MNYQSERCLGGIAPGLAGAGQQYNKAGAECVQAENKPLLEMLLNSLAYQNESLTSLLCRLRSVADRLVGPVPEPANDASKTPPPTATINQLERCAEANHELLQAAFRQVERLERI